MMLRIFRHFVPLSLLLLIVCELCLVNVVWYFDFSNISFIKIGVAGWIGSPTFRMSVLAAMMMVIAGLYHSRTLVNYRVMMAHLLIAAIFMTPLIAVGILYWRNEMQPGLSGSYLYLKAETSWLLCILITRAVFMLVADLDVFKSRVIVLGTGRRAARLAELAASHHNQSYIPIAYVCVDGEQELVLANPFEFSRGDPDGFARFAREQRANEIVVAAHDQRGLPVDVLLRCRLSGLRVTPYLDFHERQTKSIDIDALRPGWLVYSDGFRCNAFGRVGKRSVDVMLSLVGLIMTMPLLILTALLIKLETPGPALYRQRRIGLFGKPFVLLKFRSMLVDAEETGEARWALANDPRVTRIGALIRKVRLDELPQLINVLRGEMSIVGPRPERPEFVSTLIAKIPYYAERHFVKPGITGWAQVCYHYGGSIAEAKNKLAYDLYYVKNHGVFLDLIIMLQTVRVIFWCDGAR